MSSSPLDKLCTSRTLYDVVVDFEQQATKIAVQLVHEHNLTKGSQSLCKSTDVGGAAGGCGCGGGGGDGVGVGVAINS